MSGARCFTDTSDFLSIRAGDEIKLKKLLPYVPRMLNNILMHFSVGTPITYESVDEILEGLNGNLASL